MFDWVLNTAMQTDTLVNMWKENIGSLQPARYNEVWDRINDEANEEFVTVRSSRPEVFCEKGVLRNFAKFTGKHLCQSLFLIKLQASRPQGLQLY